MNGKTETYSKAYKFGFFMLNIFAYGCCMIFILFVCFYERTVSFEKLFEIEQKDKKLENIPSE